MIFIQLADVHLDSHISSAMSMPEDVRAAVLQDIRAAFARACEIAVEKKADLVLIPGDLFDYETVRQDTAAFIMDHLASIAPAKVFIAPGNHDSLRPGSPYTSADISWPQNIHIFTSCAFESIILPELDCSVTGVAHAHRGVTDRLLSQPITRPDCPTNILLFHGSRDGHRPSEKESVIPFSDDELIRQGFTYAAFGHYHSFSQVTDDGRVVGAYSGCVQGRALDECGEKYIIVGKISGGRTDIETVEVANRRILRLDVALNGAQSSDDVAQAINNALNVSGARECDIVNATLMGTASCVINADELVEEYNGRCMHLNIDSSRVLPDYDLDALRRDSASSSLRAAFAQRMIELEESAPEQDRAMLRDALYYGLNALDGRKPEPRDAD